MTAPRKDIPDCPHCHRPAYSGIVNGRYCWSCSTTRISDAALTEITTTLQATFNALGVTR